MEKQIKISSDVYEVEKIQQAISEFSDVAQIIFNNEVLTVSWESEDDIEEIFGELMNYVISL